jgi:hypothetical protein
VSDSLSDVLSTPLNRVAAAPQETEETDPFGDTTDEEADNDDNADNDTEPWDEQEVTNDVRQRLLPPRQEADAETMEVLAPSMLRVWSLPHCLIEIQPFTLYNHPTGYACNTLTCYIHWS